MISYLQGEIIDKDLSSAVILINGIGYRVHSTKSQLTKLNLTKNSSLWISENIKEDRHDLFGFEDRAELDLFERILSVNGAGPKAALAVLDIGPSSKLKEALVNSDAKYIQQASGVGKKLAERLILELSGGLSQTALDQNKNLALNINEEDEAYQALISLGYGPKDAALAISKLDPNLSLEDKIKTVLRS
jgi:Holliday junction DNA helicase RuvA